MRKILNAIKQNNDEEQDLATKMINFPLDLLYLICQHPLKSSRRAQNLLGWIFILLTLLFYFLCVMQLLDLNGDRATLFRTISSISLFTQGMLKVPPLMYYRNLLGKLLLARKKCWQPKFSEEINKEINAGYQSTIQMISSFKNLLLVTMVLYYSQPIIRRGLFMPVWIPPYKYSYEILLAIEYLMGFVEVFGMVGFNALYVTMCADLTGQFKILKTNFITMKYDKSPECFEKYKECSRHHDFLLRYVEKVQQIFMTPLIVLYVNTIITCCMEVLNILGDESNIAEKVGSLILSSSILFQMALFCIPSSNLQHEILDTADAIYLGAWEDSSLKMKKCVSFALKRAQKVVVFKTVGLVDINNETFVNVFRTTISFLTLIQQLDT